MIISTLLWCYKIIVCSLSINSDHLGFCNEHKCTSVPVFHPYQNVTTHGWASNPHPQAQQRNILAAKLPGKKNKTVGKRRKDTLKSATGQETFQEWKLLLPDWIILNPFHWRDVLEKAENVLKARHTLNQEPASILILLHKDGVDQCKTN